MSARLEATQRALELYMETKRNIFPRFYFISNDDLLDILVHSNNPKRLQPHFKKCFDNINKLELSVSKILIMFNFFLFTICSDIINLIQRIMTLRP